MMAVRGNTTCTIDGDRQDGGSRTHQVGLRNTVPVGSTANTPRLHNTPVTTCICSGYGAKQPKACAALLAAGSEASFRKRQCVLITLHGQFCNLIGLQL